jgi:hypothetical protein
LPRDSARVCTGNFRYAIIISTTLSWSHMISSFHSFF